MTATFHRSYQLLFFRYGIYTVWYVSFGRYNNNTTYRNLVKDTIISGIQCPEDDRPLVVLRTLALQNCLVSRTNFMPDLVERVTNHLEQDIEKNYPYKEYGLPHHFDDDMCSKAFPNFLVILIGLGKTWQHVKFPRDLDEIWYEYGFSDLSLCDVCREELSDAFNKGRNDAWEELSTDLKETFT